MTALRLRLKREREKQRVGEVVRGSVSQIIRDNLEKFTPAQIEQVAELVTTESTVERVMEQLGATDQLAVEWLISHVLVTRFSEAKLPDLFSWWRKQLTGPGKWALHQPSKVETEITKLSVDPGRLEQVTDGLLKGKGVKVDDIVYLLRIANQKGLMSDSVVRIALDELEKALRRCAFEGDSGQVLTAVAGIPIATKAIELLAAHFGVQPDNIKEIIEHGQ